MIAGASAAPATGSPFPAFALGGRSTGTGDPERIPLAARATAPPESSTPIVASHAFVRRESQARTRPPDGASSRRAASRSCSCKVL